MNTIQISNVTIHQTESLFSLNDLHRASGGQKKHEPHQWFRNAQTQDLIAEIEAQGKQAVQTSKGKHGGTYVCRELVVSYGMWISAAFALQVIQVFLAAQKPSASPETTTTQRSGLREAVHYLVGKRRLNFNDAYRLVHQRFGVSHIDELPADLLPQAVAYVHSLALDNSLHGEVLDPVPTLPAAAGLTEQQAVDIAALATHADRQYQMLELVRPVLRQLGSPYLARLDITMQDTGRRIRAALQPVFDSPHARCRRVSDHLFTL